MKTKFVKEYAKTTNGGYLISNIDEIKTVLDQINCIDKVSNQIEESIRKNNQGFAMTIRNKVYMVEPKSFDEFKKIMDTPLSKSECEKDAIILVLYALFDEESSLEIVVFSHENEKERESAYLEFFDKILDYTNEFKGQIDMV